MFNRLCDGEFNTRIDSWGKSLQEFVKVIKKVINVTFIRNDAIHLFYDKNNFSNRKSISCHYLLTNKTLKISLLDL